MPWRASSRAWPNFSALPRGVCSATSNHPLPPLPFRRLLKYADFRACLVDCISHKAANEWDALCALPEAPAIAAFTAKLKAYKIPEDMNLEWGAIAPAWDAWLSALEAYVHAQEAMLARAQASGRVEALGAFNARVAAAAQRMADEYAASLITKLDARTLKKMAKQAERDRLLKEAQEEAEGGGAAGRKAAKKVRACFQRTPPPPPPLRHWLSLPLRMAPPPPSHYCHQAIKKMSSSAAEGGGAGEAAAAEPLSAAMQALLGSSGDPSKKEKKEKKAGAPPGASVPKKETAVPVPGA